MGGNGLSRALGSNAMRQPLTSASIQKLVQVATGPGFVKAPHVQCPACRRNRRQSAPRQLSLQLFDPDTAAGHDLPVIFGMVGSPAPFALTRGEADTGGGAAIEPDQNDLIAVADVALNQRCNRQCEAFAVGPVSGGVVLFIDRPPAARACKCQLGAGKLLQDITPAAERLYDRADNTPVARAFTHL